MRIQSVVLSAAIIAALSLNACSPDPKSVSDQMSILKKQDEKCLRLYYDYPQSNGTAYFISTYDHDGSPLPSFSSDPLQIEINDNIEAFTQKLWDSLNPDNKISLYVRYGNNRIICNKNKEN